MKKILRSFTKHALTIIITSLALFGLSTTAFSQIVSIPDATFKNILVSTSTINSSSDAEIQVLEALVINCSVK